MASQILTNIAPMAPIWTKKRNATRAVNGSGQTSGRWQSSSFQSFHPSQGAIAIRTVSTQAMVMQAVTSMKSV